MFSQSLYQTISGKIVDAENNEPLEYAHIGLPNLGIGVISNRIGKFQFHFPDTLRNDTLMISHLGYETVWMPLEDIRDLKSDITIKLKPFQFDTEEVVVYASADSARILLKLAIENIDKNYSNKLHQLSGFYREVLEGKGEQKYTRLMEAAVDVQDKSVSSKLDNIKVRVNELRKSYDFTDYNVKYDKFNQLFASRNQLFYLVQFNPIRRKIPLSKKDSDWKGVFKFMLDEEKVDVFLKKVSSWNGRRVYALGLAGRFLEAEVYIDAEDYGIYQLSINYTITFLNEEGEVKRKETFGETFVKYNRYGKRYYLAMMKKRGVNHVGQPTKEDRKYSFGKGLQTLMINNVYLNKKDFKKIKKRQEAKKDKGIYDIQGKYNEKFWANYNVLLDVPVDSLIEADLERKVDLDEQFKNTGKKKNN